MAFPLYLHKFKTVTMKKTVLLLCLLPTAYCLSGQSMKPKDAQFVTNASKASLFEIKLGELSIAKAFSDSVKILGRQIIVDHTKANDDLKTMAVSRNITLATELDAEAQMHWNELSAKSGADFDKTFVDMMISCHQKDISLFKEETNSGSDKEVKSWAAITLPVLEHHLLMSQDLSVDIRQK